MPPAPSGDYSPREVLRAAHDRLSPKPLKPMKKPHSAPEPQASSREERGTQEYPPREGLAEGASPSQSGVERREEGPGARSWDREPDRDICDIYTRSAYLFVTDAFRIGKVRFLLGSNTDDTKVTAYASAEDLRPLVYDLFARGGLPKHVYGPKRSYEFYGGTRRSGEPVSRILRIEDDPSRRLPIVISIENGPGEVTETGGFKPADRSEMDRVAIFLSRHQARALAGTLYGRQMAVDLKRYLERENGRG